MPAPAPDEATFRQRLEALNERDQAQLLLDLVYQETAAVLGHAEAGAFDRDQQFLALGLHSLTAMELRNRLSVATGLRLPATLVFDTGTPNELASWLHAELVARSATTGEPEIDSLERMFLDALNAGKTTEVRRMVKALAALRPSFEATAELDDLPWAVTLAEGPDEPRLICVCTPTANAGVHQYAPLAAHFRGRRNVSAVPLAGFAAGEYLPATPEAAVRSIAESVLRAADGEVFALLGHSSGGLLAHAAAGVMESSWGIRPAAVIMLDTLNFARDKHSQDEGIDSDELMRINFANADNMPFRLTNSKLSAMGRWMGLLSGAKTPPSAPVLLIRSTKPSYEGQYVPGSEQDPGPVVASAAVRLVDADHMSLAREDAAATAQIIEEWLRSDSG